MFQSIFRDWNFIRIVRLVLGIMLIGQAFQIHNVAIGLFGGLFVFQSLTNTGCCGSAGCIVPQQYKGSEKKPEEIEYKEVK